MSERAHIRRLVRRRMRLTGETFPVAQRALAEADCHPRPPTPQRQGDAKLEAIQSAARLTRERASMGEEPWIYAPPGDTHP